MAPFEQQRQTRQSVYHLQDNSMDELIVEEISYQKRNRGSEHGYRDYFGHDSNSFSDYPLAATAAAIATTTPSVAHGSYITQPSSSLIPLLTSTPITTSLIPTNTQLSVSAWSIASSSQGTKDVDLGRSDYATPSLMSSLTISSTASSSPTTLSAATAPSEVAAISTGTQAPITPDVGNHSLSPTAQHVLISAATIGAIIFIGTIVYCVLRFFKIDVVVRCRKFTRRGRGSWRPGSYSGTENYCPPYTTLNDEKLIPSIQKPYAPIVIEPVPMAVLPSTQESSRADNKRQKLLREALLSKLEDTALYHETLQSPTEPQSARQPSIAYTQNRPFSELSSLSSGFGDAKIDIPESGPTKPSSHRKSRASRASRNNTNYSRFSWSSNPTTLGRTKGNRDTIYTSTTTHTTLTTSSEESGPRFRTVNSWVNHQAKRVHRQKDHDREIDSMPVLPDPAHVKKINHQRLQSEVTDAGFKYHPGDEVPLTSGNRVPSAILDKII